MIDDVAFDLDEWKNITYAEVNNVQRTMPTAPIIFSVSATELVPFFLLRLRT